MNPTMLSRVALLAIALAGTANAAVTDGLILRLPLNEGTGTDADDATDGQTCTLTGSSWTVDGTYGDVYVSTETNNIACEADSISGSTLTFAFWMRPTAYPNALNWVIDKYAPSGTLRGFRIGIGSAGTIAMQISGNGTSNEQQIAGGGLISDNVWNHVIVTFNSGTMNVYMNNAGTPSDTETFATTSIFDAAVALNVGSDTSSGATGLVGSLREVAVWNRVLDATDRTAVYNDAWAAAPTFTSAPAIATVSESGATVDYTASASGDTIYLSARDVADAQFTCDEIEAETDTHGANSETTTGSADNIAVTLTDDPEPPVVDIDLCIESSTGVDSEVVTISDVELDPPSGHQFVELTEALADDSPPDRFNDSESPLIVTGDWLLAPLSLTPGGSPPEDFELTIDGDGTFAYIGDGTLQYALNIGVYDISVGAYHLSDIDFFDQNLAPSCEEPDVVSLDHDVAAPTYDLDGNACNDPNAEQLTYEVTGGTSLPSGMSLNGSNGEISGTPDTLDFTGTAVEITATDIEGLTAVFNRTYFVLGDWTVIDLLDEDFDTAPGAMQDARPWMIEEIGLDLVLKCNNSEAANEVFAQEPAASTEVDPYSTVTAYIAYPQLCAAERRR